MNKLFYLLFLLPFTSNAQYDLFLIGPDSVIINQEVELSFNLANSDGIGTFQAKLNWDKDYLEYVSSEINTSINYMNEDAFSDMLAGSDGRVTVWWNNVTGGTTDFVDTTWFFKIRLRGIQNGFTNLELTDVEVANNFGITYDHNATNANMTIYESVDTDDLANFGDVSLGDFSPNPTTVDSYINITSLKSKDITVDVFNNIGQKITSFKTHLTQGLNSLHIKESILKTSGIYFVVFSDSQYSSTRKLIVE